MKRGDRWLCGKPAPVRGFGRRHDGARAQGGSRTLWEAERCRVWGPRRWRPPSVIVRSASGAPGWVFRDGPARARSSGPAHRGDCAGKSVVVFERRRWPRRAPRRWRRPTWKRAMRALRPGWGSARGVGREDSRAAARAATARNDRGRCSSAGGGQGGRRDGGGGRRRAAQCVHCALAGVPRRASVAPVRGRRPARRRHGKTGGGCSSAGGGQAGRRDGGGGRRRAAQCVHCALAVVPRGAAVATARGRRPARRRHGKTGGGVRAPPVTWSAAATVAAAALELRNARIAL